MVHLSEEKCFSRNSKLLVRLVRIYGNHRNLYHPQHQINQCLITVGVDIYH